MFWLLPGSALPSPFLFPCGRDVETPQTQSIDKLTTGLDPWDLGSTSPGSDPVPFLCLSIVCSLHGPSLTSRQLLFTTLFALDSK